MSRICTPDVNILFVINELKHEINRNVCLKFLDDIKKLNVDIYLFKSVSEIYNKTINNHIDYLKNILRELNDNLDDNTTLDGFHNIMRKIFRTHITNKNQNKNAKEWAKLFESCIVCKIRDIEKKLENKSDGEIITEIMVESHQIILYFQSIANSSYDLISNKAKYIKINPNTYIIEEANKIIPDKEDCLHIASCFEYAITEDKWIFYISLDYSHIVSESQAKKINNKFQVVYPMEPHYAINLIKKFNTNIKIPPLTHFYDIIKNKNNIPLNLQNLNTLTVNAFGINIIPAIEASS